MSNVLMGDSFVIESLFYFPLGASTPMFTRPFIVNSTGQGIETVVDRVNASKSGVVGTDIIGSVMSDLLQPSSVGEHCAVDNSWVSTRRYVFFMKVRAIDALGAEINSYIQGHTNYDGINEPTGSIDFQMVHHINNIIETTAMTINTPMGVIRKEKLTAVYNVFSSCSHEYYTQRPTDLIDNISLSEATNFLNDNNSGDFSSFSVGNTINAFNNNVVTSSIGNNVGTDFLCRVINGGVQQQKARTIFLNSYEVSDTGNSNVHLLEPSINDNRFVKYLSRLGGYMTVNDNFTFGQLSNVDASIVDRFILLKPTRNVVNPLLLSTPEVGDHWHGQDPVTLKAYSLIESSVSLAMKYGFQKLFFIATNMMDPTATPVVTITHFDSMISLDDMDMAHLLEIFKSKFITDVFIGESSAGRIPLTIQMYVDLLGTSKIYLEYAGFHGNWYTIPTPANSLFSPVTTTNSQVLDLVTSQFGKMINEIASQQPTFNAFY